jgi:hypothetical protein
MACPDSFLQQKWQLWIFLLLLLGYVFLGCVFLGYVFLGSVFLGSVFLGSVFLGSVFLGYDFLVVNVKSCFGVEIFVAGIAFQKIFSDIHFSNKEYFFHKLLNSSKTNYECCVCN